MAKLIHFAVVESKTHQRDAISVVRETREASIVLSVQIQNARMNDEKLEELPHWNDETGLAAALQFELLAYDKITLRTDEMASPWCVVT